MEPSALVLGIVGDASARVDAPRTAKALGSGSEDVLGTPAMIALMEAAAVACLAGRLAEGQISLGTYLEVEHLAATAAGASISARAELVQADARQLTFTVTAHEGNTLIGRGTHRRAVVDRARFLAKLAAAG